MVQKIIILTAFIALCSQSLTGAETDDGTRARPKVLIYNFKHGKDDRKNDYYSAIIPLTIIKSIGNQNVYDVRHVNEIMEFPAGSGSPGKGPGGGENSEEGIQTHGFDVMTDDLDRLEKKYDERMKALLRKLKEVMESSGEDSPGYVIGGSFTVDDNKLNINIQIYDIRGKSIVAINKKSMETGALLKVTTDELSASMQLQMTAMEERNRREFAPSPYMGLYRAMRVFSFGFDWGQAFFAGDSRKIYSDTQFINSRLTFQLPGIFALSLNLNYLGADGSGKSTWNARFRSWGAIADIDLNWHLSRYLGLSLSGGGGMSKNIEEMSDPSSSGPEAKPLWEKKSYHPVIKSTLAMGILISPLQFRFGTFYERIFLKSTPMDMYTIFAGVSYGIR